MDQYRNWTQLFLCFLRESAEIDLRALAQHRQDLIKHEAELARLAADSHGVASASPSDQAQPVAASMVPVADSADGGPAVSVQQAAAAAPTSPGTSSVVGSPNPREPPAAALTTARTGAASSGAHAVAPVVPPVPVSGASAPGEVASAAGTSPTAPATVPKPPTPPESVIERYPRCPHFPNGGAEAIPLFEGHGLAFANQLRSAATFTSKHPEWPHNEKNAVRPVYTRLRLAPQGVPMRDREFQDCTAWPADCRRSSFVLSTGNALGTTQGAADPLGPNELHAMATQPLQSIGLDQFVTPGVDGSSGFDSTENDNRDHLLKVLSTLRVHRGTQSAVAQRYLGQMYTDLQAGAVFNSRPPSLTCLASSLFTSLADTLQEDGTTLPVVLQRVRDNVQVGMDGLNAIASSLQSIHTSDQHNVRLGIVDVVTAANDIAIVPQSLRISLVKQRLRQFCDDIDSFSFSGLVAWCMTAYDADMQYMNPTLEQQRRQRILRDVIVVLLRTVRLGQANRALSAVMALQTMLRDLASLVASVEPDSTTATPTVQQIGKMLRQIAHASCDVASQLTAERHYFKKVGLMQEGDSEEFMFDPRMLVFEFLMSSLLRKRQVELVKHFSAKAGRSASSVQQAIMGAGTACCIRAFGNGCCGTLCA